MTIHLPTFGEAQTPLIEVFAGVGREGRDPCRLSHRDWRQMVRSSPGLKLAPATELQLVDEDEFFRLRRVPLLETR